MGKKIMVIAGEASGDLHGSNLIKEYKKIDSSAHFYGVGGSNMQSAGVEILCHSKELAVVGIFEVIAHFSVIYRVFNDLKKRLAKDKPDLLILIDYPDFNLRFAAYAKSIGVKVLYYISPQVWAWRSSRVKKMAKIIDKIAVIFPFEEKFYRDENMDVTFIGHPLVDCVKPTISKIQCRNELKIPDGAKVITVLPGSRRNEIKLLLNEMLSACELISREEKNCHFLVSCAPTIEINEIEVAFKEFNLKGRVIQGNVYDAVSASDFVITKSGTSTLETAILGIPMVVVYKVSFPTYLIGKMFIKTPFLSLVNIIAQEKVVSELIQGDANAKNIAQETLRIMRDEKLCYEIASKLRMVKERLGGEGASKKGAILIKEMLET